MLSETGTLSIMRNLFVIPLLSLSLLGTAFGATCMPTGLAGSLGGFFQDEDLEELLRLEREEADRFRRRGEARKAISDLTRMLGEEASDAESRVLRAEARFGLAQYSRAQKDAERALKDALVSNEPGVGALRAACARMLARVLLETGEASLALEVLGRVESDLDPQVRARDAWVLGSVLKELGRAEEAREAFRAGRRVKSSDWRELLASGRCGRALGDLPGASKKLVEADRAAKAAGGVEPEILVELGDLFFEADREVEAAKQRSPKHLYAEALRIHEHHTGALLGLFELHRYNWRRRQRTAGEILYEARVAVPNSIPVLLAGVRSDLEDGKLPAARRGLASLRKVAPKRRDVRTSEATLYWIEHRRDECLAILAELAQVDPKDATPQREVGRHLLSLYRFAEGAEFLKRAVEIDPDDHRAWQEYGRALANTGREKEAAEALTTAVKKSAGRQDAWRDNMLQVLERMGRELITEQFGELTFRWRPAASDVMREYLVPFYVDAREQFSKRYGFTSPPTVIEVFDRHVDFSVRSTGFGGFPALGVCFGPVVTAVSPLSEMRGSFSWARTAFHEFSHVVHLGLSHNRCPRWITEGLATWEEINRNPTWTRNMRRELLDSRANGNVIPVRELNRAFRGPRILFGYYQGGLLCEMLIRDYGFAPMIHLLQAFDSGLDLDAAFEAVYQATPEQIDDRFAVFLEEEYGDLALEPRWNLASIDRMRIFAKQTPPQGDSAFAKWAEEWTTIAWGSWQARRRVDAQEALRLLNKHDVATPRVLFLEGEIALSEGRADDAREFWMRGIEAGGEDYRVRVGLGSMAATDEEFDEAERQYLAAERAFPGYDEEALSAELRLASLYGVQDRVEDAMAARERWLAWNAGDVEMRRLVAAWHAEAGRHAKAVKYYSEANEVDLFLRDVHRRWGESLMELERYDEASREFRVARMIPQDLDADDPAVMSEEERAWLLAAEAGALHKLGKNEAATERAREALELDADCESARELLDLLK